MSRVWPTLCLLGALALGTALISPAQATQPPPPPPLARDTAVALLGTGGGPLVIYRDQQTGVPTFIAGALPELKAEASTPQQAARAFFAENAALFRMRDPGAELRLVRDERDRIGMSHVRFQQVHGGVEVFGAVLVAHTRGARVESVGGTYVPGLATDTRPALTFEQAAELARAAVRLPDADVAQGRSGLAVYARSRRAALTWKVELRSASGPERWLVFVDAREGGIVHRISMTETARQRETYTMNNSSNRSLLPGTLLCNEASAAGCTGDAAAQAAHDNAGTVYDYFFNTFGRDSIDGNGMKLISTVHYGSDYNNAFWNGQQMVYGDGDGIRMGPLSQSLDVVAHELTHGITQYTAGLVYEDESGALNESYSDVLGVFADAYGRSAAPNWALGEDIWTPGLAGDALRDMADPHRANDPFTGVYTCAYRPGQPYYCGQPDKVSEYARLPLSFFEEVPSDNGGVHINSGIPNKVAYLLTDGGSFGGITIPALGAAKVEQIYYRTLASYLTPYSNFLDARNASIQACADLIGQFGISADDCAAVRDAFAAVGIGPRATLSRQVYLPSVMGGTTGKGFSGLVTLNGKPVSGVTIELRRCDDRLASPCGTSARVAQATTSSTGTYYFEASASIPDTDSHTWYRVFYVNPNRQPNERLLNWFSDEIGSYAQGDSIRLDTFDIGDVTYGAPNSSTPVSFPVTFNWAARPVGGDYYIWELFDVEELIAFEYPFLMHTSPSFQLSGASDQQLMEGSSLTGAAFWDVLVVTRAGYGYTSNYGRVAFATTQASPADVQAARLARAERLAGQRYLRLAPRAGSAPSR